MKLTHAWCIFTDMNGCPVDRRATKPLILQPKERIRSQIEGGHYRRRGDLFPSERQMCRIHGWTTKADERNVWLDSL